MGEGERESTAEIRDNGKRRKGRRRRKGLHTESEITNVQLSHYRVTP